MNKTKSAPMQIPLQFGNFQNYSFESYLTEQHDELIQLLINIAKGDQINHLYLWGEEGCGKSHLLQAACHLAGNSQRQVAYIPLENLNDFSPEMLHDLGMLDLVCVDSIEKISANQQWQQSLVWLYNELRDQGNSIVIAGNEQPKTLPLKIEDLRSRLNWGLVYQVQSLSDELKMQILKQKALAHAFEIPDDVISYIMQRVERDMHSLMTIFHKIDERSLAEKRKITIPFVKSILE